MPTSNQPPDQQTYGFKLGFFMSLVILLLFTGCGTSINGTLPSNAAEHMATTELPTPVLSPTPQITDDVESTPTHEATSTPTWTLTNTPTPLEVTSIVGSSTSFYMVLFTPETYELLSYGVIDSTTLDHPVVDAATGPNHILLLTPSGLVFAFGYNNRGQLGVEDVEQTGPIEVPILESVQTLTAGADFSIAVKSDGSVWGWGVNNERQLGEPVSEYRVHPTQISGLSNITVVSSGAAHTLALRDDGVVFSWGANNSGQLGNGTTENSSRPVQVQALTSVVAVSAGTDHSLALKEDGTVWGWGDNSRGQLGYTTRDSFSTEPVQIPGLPRIMMLTAGHDTSFAISEDGRVWAWGDNSVGLLADGSREDRIQPEAIAGLTDIIDVAAGHDQVLALKRDGTVWGWGDQLLLPGIDGNDIQLKPVEITNALVGP